MADVGAEVDRARMALLGAFRRLRGRGEVTDEQFQALLDLMKELDQLPREVVADRLAALLPETGFSSTGVESEG